MQTDHSSSPPRDERLFRTYGRHMRLAHRLGLDFHRRPPGFRERPELVRLEPEPGVAPSGKPPVRIYVGTEPAQHRAERVLVWSIMAARDPARAYEIHLMSDLAGYDRRHWKTGFTAYRYAIPALAGGEGRAIYNDADQIYLGDPAELFDLDMHGKGMLSVTERETSVMLIDCAKMNRVWSLDDLRRMRLQKPIREKTRAAGLWGELSGDWNARDFEYEPGRSKLLHFTILHMQPWQPFPRQFKYEPNPLDAIWLDMERAADRAGFTIFTRKRPSRRFRETSPEEMRPPQPSWEGAHAAVERLAAATGAASIAAYDIASGGLVDYPGGQGARANRSDGVVGAIGVPGDDVPWVLDEMFAAATKFVFVTAPRPPGFLRQQASLMPSDWWRSQIESAARRHPGVRWELRFGDF